MLFMLRTTFDRLGRLGTRAISNQWVYGMNFKQRIELALQSHSAGDLDQANELYTEILIEQHDHPDANHLSGLISLANGDLPDAEEKIKKAIAASPNEAIFFNSLGNVFKASSKGDHAIQAFHAALKMDTDLPEAHYNLGKSYESENHLKKAKHHLLEAIRLNSNSFESNFSLARVLVKLEKYNDAIECFLRAVELRPQDSAVYNGLGFALEKAGRLDDAIYQYQKSIELNPNDVATLNNLGNALHASGRATEAVQCLGTCLKIDPENELAWDRYLFAMIFDETSGPESIYRENKRWANLVEGKVDYINSFSAHSSNPLKKIKIGYYSKEFYSHVSALFFETILKHHTSSEFEVFCYSDYARADTVTKKLEKKADHWIDVWGKTPEEINHQIISDRIDIFVGTTNFLASNRIVSAFRPAPIVVSYMNQVSTTGLSHVDYLIADEIICPSESTDQFFSEKLIRTSNFICYSPPHKEVKISPPPAIENKYITFGCFNNLAKINQNVVSVWSDILGRVDNSRLLLVARGFQDETLKARFLKLFSGQGITKDRLNFGGVVDDREAYLDQYNLVDIALDPFPFNGGTVTDETLYMGVPLVTLASDRQMGRMSKSKLIRLQLEDLVSDTAEEYVQVAVDLANDVDRINNLKKEIRGRALKTIFNGKQHVDELEKAYRQKWEIYCAGKI